MTLSNNAIPVEYGNFRESVLNGSNPVNQEVSMYMNIIDRRIEDPNMYYDDQAIAGFISFVEEEMTLVDGSSVTMLDSFKLWAEDLLAWYYYSEEYVWIPELRRKELVSVKRRLINKQYLIVGRGAAKSMYMAFMQAYFLTIDTNTTQQIVTAPTMKQAEETMAPIKTAIITARGPLFRYLTDGSIIANNYIRQALASTKEGIKNFLTNSVIEVRAMSIDKLQGARSKYNTVDEWLSGNTREDVITAIEGGASKNNDYIIIAASSEGTVRAGVGDSIKMELLNILRGDFNDIHTSIWYYRLDDISEVNDPNMWIKANPNIGATIAYSAYEKDVATAEANPAKRNEILAKRFGIPVEGFTYFFTYEETLTTGNNLNFDGMSAAMGADLSQGDDFTAFTFLFPLGNGKFGVKTLSFVSRKRINKLPSATQLKYDEFIKEGTLIVKEDTILDMSEVFDDLIEFIELHDYDVVAMGYDKYNADLFKDRWTKEQSSYNVETVIQGSRTESAPLGDLKHLAEQGELLFDQKLLSFAMGNSVAVVDNNSNYKLSKERQIDKIDNVAALLDAYVAYQRHREDFE